MVELLFKALSSGLSLWENAEKNKYIDRLESARRQYNEEINKIPANRSDAVLDHIEFELRLLTDSFVAASSRK